MCGGGGGRGDRGEGLNWSWGVREFFDNLSKNPNPKKKLCGGGGCGRWGGGGGVSDFFFTN